MTLAPGDYGVLRLTDRHFDPPLILRANPHQTAKLSGLHLHGVSGVTLADMTLRTPPTKGRDDHRPNVIEDSSNITLTGLHIIGGNAFGTGTPADGFGAGTGLVIRHSQQVTIRQTKIRTFLRGLVVAGGQGVTVTDSDIADIRSDGINILFSDHVTIARTHIHDFRRAFGTKDHADMIQLWTRGHDRPSRNITLIDNDLDIGAGDATQSIFARNEAAEEGRAQMGYRALRIEGNRIRNAHSHGITVGQVDGLILRNNRLLAAPHPRQGGRMHPDWAPRIRLSPDARNVVSAGNVLQTEGAMQ
ncbi:right-handed parallel beta-helix repeat-containing protein [Pseudooceanicola sp. MF1-13]|uniref:right-handed parallel beta-helix repeat-containing protein n=1 Tax=Pseudooceanicola sp. MF1-13 TaxID=3379095 RepID=UPI003891AC4F